MIMIVSVQACATAQCCTRKVETITFAVSTTFHLTPTLSQFLATCCNFKCCIRAARVGGIDL